MTAGGAAIATHHPASTGPPRPPRRPRRPLTTPTIGAPTSTTSNDHDDNPRHDVNHPGFADQHDEYHEHDEHHHDHDAEYDLDHYAPPPRPRPVRRGRASQSQTVTTVLPPRAGRSRAARAHLPPGPRVRRAVRLSHRHRLGDWLVGIQRERDRYRKQSRRQYGPDGPRDESRRWLAWNRWFRDVDNGRLGS